MVELFSKPIYQFLLTSTLLTCQTGLLIPHPTLYSILQSTRVTALHNKSLLNDIVLVIPVNLVPLPKILDLAHSISSYGKPNPERSGPSPQVHWLSKLVVPGNARPDLMICRRTLLLMRPCLRTSTSWKREYILGDWTCRISK